MTLFGNRSTTCPSSKDQRTPVSGHCTPVAAVLVRGEDTHSHARRVNAVWSRRQRLDEASSTAKEGPGLAASPKAKNDVRITTSLHSLQKEPTRQHPGFRASASRTVGSKFYHCKPPCLWRCYCSIRKLFLKDQFLQCISTIINKNQDSVLGMANARGWELGQGAGRELREPS